MINNIEQEQFDRVWKNPEKELPEVAKERYPDNQKDQEDFIKDVEDFMDIILKRSDE